MGNSPARRARLRQKRLEAQAHMDVVLTGMKAQGKFCANCVHMQSLRSSPTGFHCAPEYHHHGGWEEHTPVSYIDVCTKHKERT